MMNRLRKSASPASTWLGGIVGVPKAFRVSDRTTITFVNAVQSTSRAGAIDSTVSSRMMLTVWLGLPTPGSRSTETLPGLLTAPEEVPGAGLAAGLGRGAGVGLGTAGTRAGAAAGTVPGRGAVTTAGAKVGAASATGPPPSTRANSGASSRAGTTRRTWSATTGRPLTQCLDERAGGRADGSAGRQVLRQAGRDVREGVLQDVLGDVLQQARRRLLRLLLQLAQDG